jgi:outer membrane cobalamin receptor
VFGRVEARGRALDVDPTLGAFGGTVVGPGYALVDLGGAWRAWRATELFARTTNLFDRDYEEVVGFPNPGRAFLAGIRLAPGH